MSGILELFGSFTGQGMLGFIVIAIIVGILGYGIFMSIKLKKGYSDLIYEFQNGDIINGESGEKEFDDKSLKDAVIEFKKSASKGTENINTEVLIAKHVRKSVSVNERILNLLPSLAIALGLLGTFLGLTLAIHGANGVLESGVKTMDIFLKNMVLPLQGMASAFWTSIFGVITSIVLNVIIQEAKREKEAFYDDFEDYLDNLLYSEYAFSFTTQFERFNDTISTSMINLAKDMRSLFKEGIDELVSNINKNTLDMTESAKVLADYTKDLQLVIGSLNKSVDNFKEPIDSFKGAIDEFEITTEKLEFVMNTSVNKLSDKIDILSDVLNNLDSSIDSQKESIKLMNDEVRGYREGLEIGYKELIRSSESIEVVIRESNNRVSEQVKSLKEGYEGFEDGINDFVSNVESLREGIGEVILKVLKEELNNISEEMASKLNSSLKGIEEATESLSYNTRTVGELVRATNELIIAADEE